MGKLKISDLDKIKERVQEQTTLRDSGPLRARVIVHMGTCGISSGARKVLERCMAVMEREKAKGVYVGISGCAGLCAREPMVTVMLAEQAPIKYVDVTEDKVEDIFKNHVIGGKPVLDYALAKGSESTDMVQ